MLYIKSMVIINCIITHSYFYSKLNWFFFFHVWLWYICSCLGTCYVDRLITSNASFLTKSICSVMLREFFQFEEEAAHGGTKGASPTFLEHRQSHLESILEATLSFRWWNGAPEIVLPSQQVTAHTSSPPLLGRVSPCLDNFSLVISCVSLGCLISDSQDSYNLPRSRILNHNDFPTVLTPLKSCSSFSKFFLDFLLHLQTFTLISIIHEGMQTVGKSQNVSPVISLFLIPEHIWIKSTLKCLLDINFQ